jgi:carboxyl-terminal processing protease
VNGVRLDSVVGRLRGTPGSAVAIVLEHQGIRGTGPQLADAAMLRRSVVRVPAVPYLVMNRGIAYVPLPSVSATAGPDVYAALKRATSSGARGIVLDLRGNPGGTVDQAVEIVSAFLPPDKSVLEIRERTGATQLVTEPVPQRIDLPVVVLQDGGTASAAEIVGGALQDHDRALLVGRRSYGKGLAQSVFSLQGGWALKLTTARWFTPSGRSIHRDRNAADSVRRSVIDAETAVAAAKGFRTEGGRRLVGEGGIAPDVTVAYDTLAGADLLVARELAAGGTEANRALIRFAHALSLDVDTTFQVTPAWREALRRTLATGGAHLVVDSARWSAAAPLVTQILEQQVATFAFGPGEARRRALTRDRQYIVADSLIRAASSARDLVFHAPAVSGKRDGGV